MVEFIKNSVNYGLYILDSAIDDFITAHAGAIKEADWDLYTEGVNGIYLPYSGKIKHAPSFKPDVMDFFKGAGQNMTLGEGHDLFVIEGQYGGTSEANRDLKMANLMLFHKHHLITGTEQIYLGYRKRGENWHPFVNTTPAIVYYLKGNFAAAPTFERDKRQNYYNWKIAFRGIW